MDQAAQPDQQHLCLDCQQRGTPILSKHHPDYCVHLTPEHWAVEGWERHWGDAAVDAWPTLEILRRVRDTRVEFLVLSGELRRPVTLVLQHNLYAYGHF